MSAEPEADLFQVSEMEEEEEVDWRISATSRRKMSATQQEADAANSVRPKKPPLLMSATSIEEHPEETNLATNHEQVSLIIVESSPSHKQRANFRKSSSASRPSNDKSSRKTWRAIQKEDELGENNLIGNSESTTGSKQRRSWSLSASAADSSKLAASLGGPACPYCCQCKQNRATSAQSSSSLQSIPPGGACCKPISSASLQVAPANALRRKQSLASSNHDSQIGPILHPAITQTTPPPLADHLELDSFRGSDPNFAMQTSGASSKRVSLCSNSSANSVCSLAGAGNCNLQPASLRLAHRQSLNRLSSSDLPSSSLVRSHHHSHANATTTTIPSNAQKTTTNNRRYSTTSIVIGKLGQLNAGNTLAVPKQKVPPSKPTTLSVERTRLAAPIFLSQSQLQPRPSKLSVLCAQRANSKNKSLAQQQQIAKPVARCNLHRLSNQAASGATSLSLKLPAANQRQVNSSGDKSNLKAANCAQCQLEGRNFKIGSDDDDDDESNSNASESGNGNGNENAKLDLDSPLSRRHTLAR